MPEMRANLARMGLTYPQIDRVLEEYIDKVKHISAVNVLDSDSSGHSDKTSEPPSYAPWFQKCWSVQSDRMPASLDMVSKDTASHTPFLSIHSSLVSADSPKKETAEPSIRQSTMSWRQTPLVASVKLTLKRVVHSTYGGMLGDKVREDLSPAGFITVSQSCDVHGDAIYHHLQVQSLRYPITSSLLTWAGICNRMCWISRCSRWASHVAKWLGA
jgi:hypothetical protein